MTTEPSQDQEPEQSGGFSQPGTGQPGTGQPGTGAFLLRAPRAAFRLRTLVPVWIALSVLHALSVGIEGSAGRLVLAALAVPVALSLGAWVAAFAVKDGATGCPPSCTDHFQAFRRGLPALLFSAGATLLVPALLVTLALAGGIVGRIPWAGALLGPVWRYSGGLVLTFLAAGWMIVGIPAIFLQIPASVTEFPHSFEITSRTMNYVRNRPLLVLGGSLQVLAGAALGTAVFFVLVWLSIALLAAVAEVERGWLPDLGFVLATAQDVWTQPESWWPFGLLDPQPFGNCGALPRGHGWLLPLARLVPAFLVTSVFCGLARLYVVVRKYVDAVTVDPPPLDPLYRGSVGTADPEGRPEDRKRPPSEEGGR